MRIALDATYSVDPYPSGIAIYSTELLTALARAYPKDEFLYCYRAKQFPKALRPSLPNARRRLLLPPLPTFRADLFHALNQRVDRRPAKRVISTFHDLFVLTEEYSSPEFRARFAEQARRAAQNSDLIIAVSEFTAGQVSNLLGFERSRIRVVPHGVQQAPVNLTLGREKLILFIGALQARKNITCLVEAFERVPADWRLILAGAEGYQAESILRRIEASACRDRIQAIGYVAPAELDTLYFRASIFAFPSLDEGFGIPVLEAMAHGLPVITSNRPALLEVAGDAALAIDPYSTEELAATLNRLIRDDELRAKLSVLGRSRAQLFTWEKAVRATYAIYKEVLS
ncbi:MAG: glycosyltransferase family 1 protein [Bryobacteraceae bacterium]